MAGVKTATHVLQPVEQTAHVEMSGLVGVRYTHQFCDAKGCFAIGDVDLGQKAAQNGRKPVPKRPTGISGGIGAALGSSATQPAFFETELLEVNYGR